MRGLVYLYAVNTSLFAAFSRKVNHVYCYAFSNCMIILDSTMFKRSKTKIGRIILPFSTISANGFSKFG